MLEYVVNKATGKKKANFGAADAATKVPCEQPTENHMTYLANGSIFAVFRSENTDYPLCSTVSVNEGRTWSRAVTMPGPTGRNPMVISEVRQAYATAARSAYNLI